MHRLEEEAVRGLHHRGPAGIVVGSRAHMATESMTKRAWYRTILMKGFHCLVMLFATRNVKDTQCGFKLFTRDAARLVFPAMHTRRWAFDIEMIVIAESLGIPIKEVRWCGKSVCLVCFRVQTLLLLFIYLFIVYFFNQ